MPSSKTKNVSKHLSKARSLDIPTYKSFRLAKKIKKPYKPLPGSFKLFADTVRFIYKHWRIFGLITITYFLISVLIVRGLNVSIGASDIKIALTELFDGGELLASITLFGLLVGSVNSSVGEAASVYQGIFITIFSLATIWLLRQLWSSTKNIQMRDAFYQGMYPLVPFIFVLFVLGLQMIPIYIASFIAGTVFGAGLAITPLEQILWALLLVLLVMLSLYWLVGSIFALFIATIPKTRPVQALRAASELVRHRRLLILRSLLFLPFALLLVSAMIIFPLIIVSPAIAEWIFLLLSAFLLPASVTYLYGLYRGLL